MIALIILVILALMALIVWMADGVQQPEVLNDPPRTIDDVTASTSTKTDELTVITWNIAWAYGWGSEGSGGAKEKAHFDRTLEKMGEVLAAAKPDVVLLQEVDFDATRSHHMDQAKALAEKAGLPYVADAVSWRANWVPFPYWPPKDQFGQMISGGAVLSRFPIKKNRVELMAKPDENPFWYNLFYLFRYHQTVEIDAPAPLGQVFVVNTHLEAFNVKNRERQARRLAAYLDGLDEPSLVFGGDLNSVPEEATVRKAYEDEPQTDHENDRTVSLMRAVDGLSDAIPDTSTQEESWHTFPAHAPNRKLDYLFFGDAFTLVEARTLTEAGSTSDHLPVLIRLAPRPKH